MMQFIERGHDWPDATGGIPCCMGYAANGHRFCTCWEPVYDQEQLPHDGSMPGERTTMCHDCAYRKNSPERSGDEGYSHNSSESLEDAAMGRGTFFCHQGTAKTLRYRHPSGMVVEAHPADYHWIIVEKDGQRFPLKADGSAQDVCAGFLATRRKALQEGR